MIPLPSELILPLAGFMVSDPSQIEPLTGGPWNFWIVVDRGDDRQHARLADRLRDRRLRRAAVPRALRQVPADPRARDRDRRPLLRRPRRRHRVHRPPAARSCARSSRSRPASPACRWPSSSSTRRPGARARGRSRSSGPACSWARTGWTSATCSSRSTSRSPSRGRGRSSRCCWWRLGCPAGRRRPRRRRGRRDAEPEPTRPSGEPRRLSPRAGPSGPRRCARSLATSSFPSVGARRRRPSAGRSGCLALDEPLAVVAGRPCRARRTAGSGWWCRAPTTRTALVGADGARGPPVGGRGPERGPGHASAGARRAGPSRNERDPHGRHRRRTRRPGSASRSGPLPLAPEGAVRSSICVVRSALPGAVVHLLEPRVRLDRHAPPATMLGRLPGPEQRARDHAVERDPGESAARAPRPGGGRRR